MDIPGFELLAKIGQGGMATVWKAKQLSLDRVVAIKILSGKLSQDPGDVASFLREAQAMAALKHPGIIQVYDASVREGHCYFIMEYVEGYSVGTWIRRRTVLPQADALLVAEHVAHALNYAWTRHKLIHCDVKPDNIMIDADGTIKVADLGLSRSVAAGRPAETADITGTPNYISPEQVLGHADLDCRVDIYALGATLYHMTTGKMLFEGDADTDVIGRQISSQVDDPLDVNPQLSMGACWLIEKMLAKDRQSRHPDWVAVLADLAKVRAGGMPADPLLSEGLSTVRRSAKRTRPTGRTRRAARPTAREPGAAAPNEKSKDNTALWIAAGIVLLAAAIGVVFRSASGPPAASPSSPSSTRAPERTERPPDGASDAVAEQMYGFALQWADEHPTAYDAVVAQFTRVANDTQGTRFSRQAAARAAEWRAKKVKEIDNAMVILDTKAQVLLNERQFDAAAAVYADYTGPFVDETSARRKDSADRIRRDGVQDRLSKEFAVRDMGKKAMELMERTASDLAEKDLPTAQRKLAEAMDAEGLRAVAELAAVDRLLRQAVDLDARIFASFEQDKGRVVPIITRAGVRTVQIAEVAPPAIRGEERVMSAGLPAVRPIVLTLADLAPAEQVRRLGAGEETELMLKKGCLAIQARAFAEARVYMGKIAPPLGPLLMKVLEQAAARAAQAAAEKALPHLAQELRPRVSELYDEASITSPFPRPGVRGTAPTSPPLRFGPFIPAWYAIVSIRLPHDPTTVGEEPELIEQGKEGCRLSGMKPMNA